jgi:8-oxo-dGTP diphosphatase
MELQVGVKALIKQNGKYLVVQRDQTTPVNPKPYWTIPGGRLNPGEPFEQALAREIKEETGLIMMGVPKILYAQDIIRNDLNTHIVRLTFEVSAEGTVILDSNNVHEHLEYKWVTMEELKKMDYDFYLKPLIDQLTKH